MLVLPPSFPYGGMENPRMTFLTPTLLAGDRSLVDVVAHELAHSWTGNLVTNADMEHFWLNEGFTVWAERRILEALHGEEAAALALGDRAERPSTSRSRASATDSPLTVLRTHLGGRRPRRRVLLGARTRRARGSWRCSSARWGASASTASCATTSTRFRFTSITTEEFLAFLEAELPGVAGAGGRATEWLHEPGHAGERARVPLGRACEALDAPRRGLRAGARGRRRRSSRAWSPDELLVYLQHLPRELDAAGVRLARRARSSLTGARQLRDPGRVADHRRRLRLRAGLRAACARC